MAITAPIVGIDIGLEKCYHQCVEMKKKDFLKYVESFYGKGGIYDMGATKLQIAEATEIYIKSGADVAFDSIDRERVRDILIERFGLVFPT